jgi:hypothetical protein
MRAPEAALDAGCLKSLSTKLTLPAAEGERGQYTISRFDVTNVLPNALDDSHRFVSDRDAVVVLFVPPIKPEIRAADGGVSDSDNGIAGFLNFRIRSFFNLNVVGSLVRCNSHSRSPVGKDLRRSVQWV